MGTTNDNSKVADGFGVVAERFCSAVDSASNLDRAEFVTRIYRILPKLIDEAISLPNVQSSDSDYKKSSTRIRLQEWERLYDLLKEKLGEWDRYRQVFDPTQDNEAIFGSLADDVADIYRDLKDGLALNETERREPENAIWEWRLAFQSHWGKHAIDALLTIHVLLQNRLYRSTRD